MLSRALLCMSIGAVVLVCGCRDESPGAAQVGASGAGGSPAASGSGGAGAAAMAGSGGALSGAGTTTAGGGGSGGQPSSALGLAVGPFSACIVGPDQVVKCAGRCGPSGHGGSRDQAPPGVLARSVVVGREFACALLAVPAADGDVRCWGAGPGAEPPNLTNIVELAAGDVHACARHADGAVTCWGDATQAPAGGVSAKALAASGAMTCVIVNDDSIACWGPNAVTPPAALKAKQLALSSQLADPLHGPRFGCVVSLTGDVRCFGDDVGGVQAPPAGLMAKRVAVGRSNACAIGVDDRVSCWGTAPRDGLALPTGLQASVLSLAFRAAGALDLSGKFVFWGDGADERVGL